MFTVLLKRRFKAGGRGGVGGRDDSYDGSQRNFYRVEWEIIPKLSLLPFLIWNFDFVTNSIICRMRINKINKLSV